MLAPVTDDPYYHEFIKPILEQKGDKLPVSKIDAADGTVPTGTTKYEKRGIAVDVPQWHPGKLHPVQPVLSRLPARLHPPVPCRRKARKLPASFITKPAIGKEFAGLKFRVQLSPLDCTGCGNCVDVCPAKEKALKMVPLHVSGETEEANWD